ncbi:Phage protein [Lysobacter dokdonensis DS-58]|uniref:Phage protein n=1 Tax=Lysobacter dokdonensis DS-58 TaxID=1300345 RepID=A0A0A2WMG9_9GAMM|nr:phage tail terminator-like protein [Lysobacter dokdonensis]KGQ19932.1 Phage protein [Lysobacter dokdonensis DS-58]
MSAKRIRAIYEGRLKTWADARSPALSVAFENVPFNPANGSTYLRAFLLPAATTSPDLAGALTTYRGVFQVSVCAPINKGAGAALGIADELAALFVVNARLTASGFTVQQITPCSVAPALQDDTHYIVPVSFEYRADT